VAAATSNDDLAEFKTYLRDLARDEHGTGLARHEGPMTSKILYCGEWVRVKNMMNKKFPANGGCEICRRWSCAVVWWSYKTKRIRCTKCFDAEAEHWKVH
jgi:hypothetical protein